MWGREGEASGSCPIAVVLKLFGGGPDGKLLLEMWQLNPYTADQSNLRSQSKCCLCTKIVMDAAIVFSPQHQFKLSRLNTEI